MNISDVHRGIHKARPRKRLGRGIGSGQGKTAGLGHKGQYASAGARLPSGLFEGGQMPLYRRLPKRGFTNATFKKDYAIVNVGDLERVFDANSTVDMEALKQKRLVVGTFDGLRVLGNGELTKPLTVKADHFSKSAAEKIKMGGGTAEVLPKRKPPVRNKMGTKKKELEAKLAAKASEKQ
jgi:large subunit ribosomal protein L15